MTALPEELRYVMKLKLPHRQMHYRQSSFFTDLKGKTTTKRIENMLPGHEKLKIYFLTQFYALGHWIMTNQVMVTFK